MRKHCQLRSCRGIYSYIAADQIPLARSVRGYRNCRGNPLSLPESFVISKDKCLVLDNWPTRRGTELISPELRYWNIRTPGKVISRVQCAVANEFVCVTVKRIRTGLGDGIYNSAGGLAILCGETSGQHGELLDSVDAQCRANYVPRPAVGVIVDADAVQPIVVVCCSLAGNRKLSSKAAVAARRLRIVNLSFNQVYTRVERGE